MSCAGANENEASVWNSGKVRERSAAKGYVRQVEMWGRWKCGGEMEKREGTGGGQMESGICENYKIKLWWSVRKVESADGEL